MVLHVATDTTVGVVLQAVFTVEDNKLFLNPGPSAKEGSGCRFVRTFTPDGHTVVSRFGGP